MKAIIILISGIMISGSAYAGYHGSSSSGLQVSFSKGGKSFGVAYSKTPHISYSSSYRSGLHSVPVAVAVPVTKYYPRPVVMYPRVTYTPTPVYRSYGSPYRYSRYHSSYRDRPAPPVRRHSYRRPAHHTPPPCKSKQNSSHGSSQRRHR